MGGSESNETGYALAFETSSAWGSVALGLADRVLEVRHFSGPRRHAREFLPTVAALCEAYGVSPGSITRVYASSGPGSFTGLRIGVTAARMMALAIGARIVSVPTLDVIAQNAFDAPDPPPRVAVILDAKRGRVYAAVFTEQDGHYVPLMQPIEAEPAEFLARQTTRHGRCAAIGEGVLYHRRVIEASGSAILPAELYPPRAETVYRLGCTAARAARFEERRSVIPIYVRAPEAEEKWEARTRND